VIAFLREENRVLKAQKSGGGNDSLLPTGGEVRRSSGAAPAGGD